MKTLRTWQDIEEKYYRKICIFAKRTKCFPVTYIRDHLARNIRFNPFSFIVAWEIIHVKYVDSISNREDAKSPLRIEDSWRLDVVFWFTSVHFPIFKNQAEAYHI